MKPVLLSFVPEPAGAEIFYCVILFRNRPPGGKKRVHAVGTWFRNTPQPFSYIPVRSRAILDRKWRDQTEERKKTFGPIGFLRRRTYSNRAQPQSCFAHWRNSRFLPEPRNPNRGPDFSREGFAVRGRDLMAPELSRPANPNFWSLQLSAVILVRLSVNSHVSCK